MKADEICENYAEHPVGLVVRLLEEDDGSPPTTVLIEGPGRALRMLASLLVAIADEKDDEGFSISPYGAGKLHFSDASELGVYIHRLPE